MKGLILAGGRGSRLSPLNRFISKHLLPVAGKPMIYYPLSILMLIGIKEICIVCNPRDKDSFIRLLGSGERLGLDIQFIEQPEALGIVDGIKKAERFIEREKVAVILGDNFFHGSGFIDLLKQVAKRFSGATGFSIEVNDPKPYGVLSFNSLGQVVDIEEKPTDPASNKVLTGLYFYDESLVEFVNQVCISSRGEFEITDLNRIYLRNRKFNLVALSRGVTWSDLGRYQMIESCGTFILNHERASGLAIGCIEEISLRNRWIGKNDFASYAAEYGGSDYGELLKRVLHRVGSQFGEEG